MKEKHKIITDLLLKSKGIDVSNYEATFLIKSIQKRMSEIQCSNIEDYFLFMQNNGVEAQLFIDSLQICYTEFFRNSLTFSVFEKIILPTIVMNKTNLISNEIRIWCAACASGQETYSIAMLLKEYLKGVGEKINFRIFATDQSEAKINEAKQGEYSYSALNNLSLKRFNRWFIKQGSTYSVNQELKQNIEFSVFDLFDEQYCCPPTSIFGDFDLVVCSNLLFYYKPAFRKLIIEKTSNCMAKKGFLITGETEREQFLHAGFQEVYPQSAIFKK